MTREEERHKAAKEFTCDKTETSDFFDKVMIDCFYYGAEWADEHPKEGLVSIDKVCKWLENDCDIKEYLGGIFSGTCSVNFDWEKLSDNLRKAMEE